MIKETLTSSLKRGIFYAANIFPIFSIGNKIRIIMYHGVDDIKFPASTFESHLQFYTKHFETFFASEIPQLLQNNCKTTSGKPPLVLTFDDGLKNNATIVAPLIEKYDAKATFYLISGLLEGGKMMWNHELFCRIMLLDDDQRQSLSTELTTGLPHDDPNHAKTLTRKIRDFIDQVKRWSSQDKEALLNSLREQCSEPPYSDAMRQSYEIMSSKDACALPSCIEVGSHTINHSILDTLTFEEGKKEVVGSKEALIEKLQCKIETFCYPNGNYTPELANIVEEQYSLGVTTKEGFAKPGDALSQLNRISSRIDLFDMCTRLLVPRE